MKLRDGIVWEKGKILEIKCYSFFTNFLLFLRICLHVPKAIWVFLLFVVYFTFK